MTTLSDTARRLLADLPPFEQASPTIQRTLDAMARELDRVDVAVDAVRAETMPSTSAIVLRVWEALFKLPVEPVGRSLALRRAAVVAYLTALGSSGSGLDWEAAMTALVGTGWSYREYASLAERLTSGNLIADPRGRTLANWTRYPSSTATLALDAGPEGLVAATTATEPTWVPLLPVPFVAPHDGAIAPGEYFACRARIKILTTIASPGRFTLEFLARDAGGTPGWNPIVAHSAPANTLPVGTVIELAGVTPTPAPAGSARAGLSIGFPEDSVVAGYQIQISRMMAVRVDGPTAEVPPWFSGSTRAYDWAGTVDDSVSVGESPGPYVIRIYLPFTEALAAPAQPSGTPSGGGGPTYFWSVTAINFYGETTASPDRSTNLPAAGTVTLDWPDIAGATGYRVYRGTATGNKQLVAETVASTYVDNGNAAISATAPPIVNTTPSPLIADAARLARAITPANHDLEFGYTTGFILGVSRMGEPI